MLDSINVGMTGLLGYAKGLRVIANNTANLNTPGYKASTLEFADLFYANAQASGGNTAQLGHGLATAGTQLDFRAGDLRQTGNSFDLGLDGEGLFVLRNDQGETRYTRAGQFEFDGGGVLVNRIDGSKVMGVDAAGAPTEISLAGLKATPGKATAEARFTGNLSSTSAEQTVGAVTVYDATGVTHDLSVKFTSTNAEAANSWKVELLDGTTSVGTGQLVFADGRPTAASAKLAIDYRPAGAPAMRLALDFGSDVTSFASGSLSTLAMSSQDGYAPGNLTKAAFDEAGALVASYGNGQTVKGPRLQLARFPTLDAVLDAGGNQFAEANGIAWDVGVAGEGGFGPLRTGVLEMSNVDLSREFSDLVVMQRGYQASSQIISTANDMLQELFRMKAK
jgi:flagellar hook protein FlgE